MKATLRRIIHILLALAVLLAPCAQGEGAAQSRVVKIPVEFYNTDNLSHPLEAEYCDDYFLGDPHVYNHALARASLTAAVSAFRHVPEPIETQNRYILDYMRGAGFEDIEADSYLTETGAETVANALGHKVLPDGRTLVMLAVCGGGYNNEWLSNLNVGDETRHTGFNAASHIVQDRLWDYLDRMDIRDHDVLWITGYSRGGGISNITAADLIDANVFDKVFAYTFATPRTTRQKGDYQGIFNIMGSQDIVPEIPFVEWGYGRYGTDMFLGSQENDSDYSLLTEKADAVSRALIGKGWRNNPAVNEQLHEVLRYLYSILSTSAEYRDYLYPELCAAWKSLGTENLLSTLKDAVARMDGLPPEKSELVGDFLNYLSSLIYEYTAGGNIDQVNAGMWDKSTTLKDNIMHEHAPATYLSAVLSTEDPDDIFTRAPDFMRFVASGDLNVDIFDEYGIVTSVGADGRIADTVSGAATGERETESCPKLYILRQGTQTIVDLPEDRQYLVSMTCRRETEASYFGTVYSPDSLKGESTPMHHLGMLPQEEYFVICGRIEGLDGVLNGQSDYSTEIWDRSQPYTPGTILALENTNFFRMDLVTLIFVLVLAAGICVIILLISIILAIIRVIRGRRRMRGMTITFHALMLIVSFLLEEGARYYVRGYPFVMSCLKGLVSLNIALLAAKGLSHRDHVSEPYICLGLLFCGLGDVLMNILMPLSLVADAIGVIVIALGYAAEKRPKLWQLILWGLLTAAFTAVIVTLRVASPIPYGFFIAFGAAFALMLSFSLRIRWQSVAAVVIFMAANCLLGRNMIFGETKLNHMLSLGLYYLAAFILACTTWVRPDRKKGEPLPAAQPAGEKV